MLQRSKPLEIQENKSPKLLVSGFFIYLINKHSWIFIIDKANERKRERVIILYQIKRSLISLLDYKEKTYHRKKHINNVGTHALLIL